MITQRFALFAGLLMLISSGAATADLEAVAVNGKRVLLKDDGRWHYLEAQQPDERRARLSLVSLQAGNDFCRLGLTLKNDLADKITSMIFMFSAYVGEEVLYETVTKGYQHIRPTNQRYNEVTFSGVRCDEILFVRVHGADRCEVGELNKFSAARGACLALVEVEPSRKLVMLKRYEDEPTPQATETSPAAAEADESLEAQWARELEYKRYLEGE